MSSFRVVGNIRKVVILIVTMDSYPSSVVRETRHFYSSSKFIALYLEEQAAFIFSVILSRTIIK
jgi:hypothetical protein